MTRAGVSVCIATRGGAADLDRALRSVLAQEMSDSIEVWVVDNASADGSVAMVRERYPIVRILTNAQNHGYSRAINQAAAQATGEWLLFLSSDAELGPTSLERMVAFARAHERIGALGPQTVGTDGMFVTSTHHPSLLVSMCAELTGASLRLRRARMVRTLLGVLLRNTSGLTSDYTTNRQVKVIDGGCLLVSARAFEAVAGLDPMIPQGPDDYDLCRRLRTAGYEIWFVADAQATHRSTIKDDAAAMAPAYLRTFVPQVCYFYRKHGGAVTRLAARVVAVQLLRKYLRVIKRVDHDPSERISAVEDALVACGNSQEYIELIEREFGPEPPTNAPRSYATPPHPGPTERVHHAKDRGQ
jgi:GT2 family glycosyltransferase